MNLEELRKRADTLGQRAVGGADVDKLIPLRDALFTAIIDTLREIEPRREIVDVHELRRQLDALTGAGVPYQYRQLSVQRALEWVYGLIDKLDPARREPHIRPDFGRVWHER